MPEIDQSTDKWVALFALAIGLAAMVAQWWQMAGVCMLIALAVLTVIVWRYQDLKRAASFIADWTDTDSRLADVAIANTERPL